MTVRPGDVEMPSGVLKAVSGVVTGLLKPIYKMLGMIWKGMVKPAGWMLVWKVEVSVGPIQIRKGDDCMLGEGVNSKDMIKF